MKFSKQVDIKYSQHTKKQLYEVKDILIGLTVVMISQCITKHHIVHLKYIQFLFVNYTSTKLKNKILRLRKKIN